MCSRTTSEWFRPTIFTVCLTLGTATAFVLCGSPKPSAAFGGTQECTTQPFTDCDNDGICDVDEIQFCNGAPDCLDCNLNGIPDGCETDCNFNLIPDDCDITNGTSQDCNLNGIPDECECPGPMVYVSNTGSDDVWVVDMAAAAVVAVVPVGNDPRGIDISPDNSRVYVANRFGDSVSVIDTSTNTVVQTIDLAGSALVTANEPYDVAVSPDGSWLYIAMKNGGSENGDGTVVVVDLPAGTIVAEVILDSNASPEGIVVTPNGRKVYVAARGSMYVVDVSVPTAPVFLQAVGSAGRELVASPDGAWIYANNNAVRTIDDVAFGTGESSGERGITISPDGLTLYSTNENNFAKVVQVDLSSGTPVTTFVTNIQDITQSNSYGIDLTDEGDRGVVSFRNSNTVRIFNTTTSAFIGPVIPMQFNAGAGMIFGSEPKQLVIAHTGPDCNGNAIPDRCDIAMGCSQDCNGNGIPDECEVDCNNNGVPDDCDLVENLTATGSSSFIQPRVVPSQDLFQFINPVPPVNLPVGSVNASEGLVKDIAVDPTTGSVYTIGLPLFCNFPQAVGLSQSVYLVDTATGVGTPLPQPTGFIDILGLTFGLDGTLFGISVEGFFTIDKTTGAAQLLPSEAFGIGMATSPAGQIYSITYPQIPLAAAAQGLVDQSLQLHDPATGNVLNTVSLSIQSLDNAIMDIAFATDGVLYGISGNIGALSCGKGGSQQSLPAISSNLCIINPATGDITPVGPLDGTMLGLGGPLLEPASQDCNNNGIPDECEPDCDGDGIPDDCDLTPETEPPVITGCPQNISGGLNAECGFTAPDLSLDVDATDNCTATEDLVVTTDPADLSTLGVGENTVTVTVTDEAGNATSCTVVVTINQGDCILGGDTPPPQPVPCDPSTGGLNILMTLLFHAPVCGMGCPLMMLLTICGLLSLKARNRRRRNRR